MKINHIYKIYRLLGVFLLLWSIIIILIYSIVTIKIGYFPLWDRPDPKDLNIGFLNWFYNGPFMISLGISMYSELIFLLLFIIHMIICLVKKIKPNFRSISLSSVGPLLFILMLYLPGLNEILGWLID